MMKKKLMLASSIATTFLATATAVSGIMLTNRLMYIKPKEASFIYDREVKAKRFDEAWYNGCLKDELTVQSPNDYTIKGIFLKPLSTKNTVIICHGVTESKMNSIKYARMYERLGFNTVVYDHRRHGDSGGKTTSYGHYEKYDLQALVQAVKAIIGEDALLGIHGESMGAATTLLYAGTVEDHASFYISDCAFSDFRELLALIIKNSISIDFKFAVHFTNIFIRLREGYSFDHVNPKLAVKNIMKPTLFIHSEPDDFIPSTMTEQLFEAKPDAKMLKIFKEGAHAQSFNVSPFEYEQVITKFLQDFIGDYRNNLEIDPFV
ncbi:alpha/beta hydrolase [Solibacillus cecembensis]|uniref:alpha/beta hydrolase n=1 Tax=Solibacillus cecembensis TaxID=459347 RepID=UPI003D0497D0